MQRFEKGNVLFLVLITVVLFAALSYAVTQSSRGGGNADSESAELKASEVSQYVSSLHFALQRLMTINGCSDEELSFERSPFDGSDTVYVNPSSPADFSCHVFHPSGGGIAPRVFDFAGAVSFSARNYVPGQGKSTPGDSSGLSNELMILIHNIDEGVCRSLNKANSVGSSPYDPVVVTMGNASTTKFIGVFGRSDSMFNSAYVDEPYAMCVVPNTVNGIDRSSEYWYYSVLHVR